MTAAIDRFRGLMDDLDSPEQALVVVNRTRVDPIQRLLEGTFETQSVSVSETTLPEADENLVLLVRDGSVVASSPFQAVIDTCLMVNSDRYLTGAGGLDTSSTPSVITELGGTIFDLRGYPASNREKLLLIVVSRFIERLTLDSGTGTLRATFQRLSRVGREPGTRRVYERLAASDVDVHVYGEGDWTPPADWDLSAHTGNHRGYREAWCVVYVPAAGGRHAALVALETGDNEWRGFWSYDPGTVCSVRDVIVEEF